MPSHFHVLFLGLLTLSCSAATVCSAPASNPLFVRSESQTELLGDLTFRCSGTGGVATIQVLLSPAVNITSAVLSSGYSGYTEALAISSAGTAQGIVDPSGSSITFSNVSIPAAATVPAVVTITNIRIDATYFAGITAAPSVQAAIYISGSGIAPQTLPPVTVANPAIGMGSQSTTGVAPDGSVSSAPPANIPECSALTASAPSFYVKFGEGFGNAFRLAGSAATNGIIGNWAIANTETGYVPPRWPNTPGASNLAQNATRIRIVLNNVPENALTYFPITLSTDAANQGTLVLTASETGPFSPLAATAPAGTSPAPGAPSLALLPNSYGAVEAVYEVVKNSSALESYTLPVYFAWAANTVTGDSFPVAVSVSFAPVVNQFPPYIPSFAVTPSSADLSGPTVQPCSTSLLFPFVTNQSGFDTAIVIANTASDPFNGSGGAQQSGTCSLNFYGNGAPDPDTDVPAPGGDPLDGSYLSGQIYAFALSSVAAGFQGYAIAVCTFPYAHGYASITSDVGQPSATAMGYPGLVLTRGDSLPAEASKN